MNTASLFGGTPRELVHRRRVGWGAVARLAVAVLMPIACDTSDGEVTDAAPQVMCLIESGTFGGPRLPGTSCAGRCLDLGRDPTNCGACGRACSAGQVCNLGRCVSSCSAGLTDCCGGCVDVMSDQLNCGACGHACSDCRAGRCCFPSLGCCERGVVLCAFTDGYACCAPRSDPSHCGSCGRACATGQTCIDSACR